MITKVTQNISPAARKSLSSLVLQRKGPNTVFSHSSIDCYYGRTLVLGPKADNCTQFKEGCSAMPRVAFYGWCALHPMLPNMCASATSRTESYGAVWYGLCFLTSLWCCGVRSNRLQPHRTLAAPTILLKLFEFEESKPRVRFGDHFKKS